MDDLVKELLKLQIRQTEIIAELLQSNATESETGAQAGPQVVPPDNSDRDTDRPLRIGDQVRVLNPGRVGRVRSRRDTVYTVTRIGKRVTSVTPEGVQIIRAAHILERL